MLARLMEGWVGIHTKRFWVRIFRLTCGIIGKIWLTLFSSMIIILKTPTKRLSSGFFDHDYHVILA